MKKLISLFMALLFLLGTVPAFADETQELVEQAIVLDALFGDGTAEAAGEALVKAEAAEEIAEEVAAAANEVTEKGTFTGTVIDGTEDTFSVINESGSILTFIPSPDVDIPQLGSVVTIEYEGSLVAQPIARSISILSQPELLTEDVTVIEATGAGFTATTENGSPIYFRLSGDTYIDGLNTKLGVGQTVEVSYCVTEYGNMAVMVLVYEDPVAVAEYLARGDELTNKKLTGKIVKITTKRITIKTKKGKIWKFKISRKTKWSGKYLPKIGATVTITYDGYAAKHPLAKRIKIRKPASSTKYRTKKGTCAFFEGMMIGLTNGFEADCANAKNTGKGKRGPGTKVRIKYYRINGMNYAVRIKWYKKK